MARHQEPETLPALGAPVAVFLVLQLPLYHQTLHSEQPLGGQEEPMLEAAAVAVAVPFGDKHWVPGVPEVGLEAVQLP